MTYIPCKALVFARARVRSGQQCVKCTLEVEGVQAFSAGSPKRHWKAHDELHT